MIVTMTTGKSLVF